MTSTQKMKMKVGDSFPAVRSVVHDKAVSGLVQFQLAGDFLGGGEEMAEDGMMLRRNGGMARVVLLRNEENVNRGLGSDVAEGEDMGILIDDVGLGFAVDDPFEDRFGHGPSFLPDGQFEELGAEMAGARADKVDDLVVEPLAGTPPRRGAGKGKNAGAETFQAEHGGEGGDFFIDDGGQALKKDHFQGRFLGEGGQIDGRGGGGEFEVTGDGRAADAREGTAEDHFQSIPLDDRADEVVPKIVENGAGDFRGEGPFLMAGPGRGFFQGKDQPRLVQTGGLDSGGGDQGQRP